jgi:hypothetical protein
MEMGGGGRCSYGTVKVGEKKENSDLKIGHVMPKYECIRMYKVHLIAFMLRVCVR